jgi:lysophospholipase L1-like esterase
MRLRIGGRPILCGLILLGLGVARADDKKENTATKPVPRDEKWTKRHEGFVATAKKGGIDLLFLGDSITDAWGGEGHNPKAAGAKVFAQEFLPLKAANFGIGGDRTQHVLWRIENGELKSITPKVTVLMIGTNNADNSKPDDVVQGITAIVKGVRTRLPKTRVLLLAVFPRGQKPGEMRERLKRVNSQIAKLDDGEHVRFLDIGGAFVNEDGTISPEIMPDYLHLSPQGYRKWADAMEPTLSKMLDEPKPKEPKPAAAGSSAKS